MPKLKHSEKLHKICFRKKKKKSSSNMNFWLVNQEVFGTDFYFVK